ALDLAASDTVMLAMPFSRAAGWGGLFAGPAAGAKLVLPGPRMDAQSLQSLAEAERANVALASPADVKALLEHLQATGGRLGSLKRIIAAGGQLPPNLAQEFKSNFGVQVRSAYGLTETGALGVVGDPLVPGDLRPPFGLELAVTDGAGNPLPRDNAAIGRLKAKGATVASGYLGAEGAGLDPHGFLDTGDLGAADAAGSLRLTDRASEVISSGGQWISARALESAALEHPATAEVAAIAFPSDDGADRPLLVVRRRPGANAGKQEYLAFLQRRLPRGQSPADVLFVEGLPLDAAGRIDKRVLRDRLDRHRARAEGRAVEAPVAAVASVAAAAPMLYSPASPPPVHDESVRASAAPEPVIAGVETLAADDTVKAASAEHLAEVTARPEAEPPIADEPISLVASETAATESVEASHAAAEDAPAEPEPAEPMVETVTPEPGSPPGPALDGPTDAVMADARPAPPPSVVIVDPAVDEAEAPLLIAPAKPKKRKSVNGPVGLYLNLAVALALLPLALMAIGYGLVRFGLIDAQQGVSSLILDWPFKLATVGVVTGLIGLFAALFAGFGKVWRRALIALGLPVLVIAGFIAFRTTAEAQPPIHEVATDWADPIAFSPRLLALRGRGANPVMDEAYVPSTARTYAGRRIAEVNAETCQAAKPAILATDPAQAYARAKAALQEQGWTLVSDLAAEGRLEATRENILLGEKDDMAVRVQAYGAGARVDARASARSGESDLGRNCANVGDLIAAVRG
ncbi:MAG: AMP-binding protein, partial [Caulobacteraceae bacterium]